MGEYMKYLYRRISCYYKKGDILILMPKGKLLPFGGGIDIEPVFELQFPINNDNLKKIINECFELCWSEIIDGIPKGPSVIEKHLNIRGYKKVVRQYDFFSLRYDKVSKEYILEKTFKDLKAGCYSGIEEYNFGNKIDYDFIMKLIQG